MMNPGRSAELAELRHWPGAEPAVPGDGQERAAPERQRVRSVEPIGGCDHASEFGNESSVRGIAEGHGIDVAALQHLPYALRERPCGCRPPECDRIGDVPGHRG